MICNGFYNSRYFVLFTQVIEIVCLVANQFNIKTMRKTANDQHDLRLSKDWIKVSINSVGQNKKV